LSGADSPEQTRIRSPGSSIETCRCSALSQHAAISYPRVRSPTGTPSESPARTASVDLRGRANSQHRARLAARRWHPGWAAHPARGFTARPGAARSDCPSGIRQPHAP